jgi:lipid-binding SYLF domain-containing protein
MRVAQFVGALVLGLAIAGSAIADGEQETIDNFKKSPTANQYFAKSYGYAVFPTIGKGGIGIGGAGGKGLVYRGGQVTGESSMAQVSIGFQFGGQAYSQIIFFEDKRAYDEFTSGEFEFGAGASAVAITAGVQAQSGTTGTQASLGTGADHSKATATNYTNGMAVLTLAKGGLMYEAVLAGQKYKFKAK